MKDICPYVNDECENVKTCDMRTPAGRCLLVEATKERGCVYIIDADCSSCPLESRTGAFCMRDYFSTKKQ